MSGLTSKPLERFSGCVRFSQVLQKELPCAHDFSFGTPPILVHPQQVRDLVPEEQDPGQIWSRADCFSQVVSRSRFLSLVFGRQYSC
jgi:hypothetical protein